VPFIGDLMFVYEVKALFLGRIIKDTFVAKNQGRAISEMRLKYPNIEIESVSCVGEKRDRTLSGLFRSTWRDES